MNTSLDKFYDITGYNIRAFFQKVSIFISNKYSYIVSYYNGGDENSSAFTELDYLIKQCTIIEPLFELNKNYLNDIGCIEILDLFSDIQNKLWTIQNSAKWQRSARLNRFNSIIVQNKILKTGQTLENISSNQGSVEPQNDWTYIAIDNLMEEENYTPMGSESLFKIAIDNKGNSTINNIVDTMTLEKINDSYYSKASGKDISVDFHFVDNDFEVVQFKQALIQTFNTILSTFKGSIPEFPEYGLPNEIVGGTVNGLQYPIIFKALTNMFQADSRWKQVELLDLKVEGTAVHLIIKATAISDEVLINNIRL